MATLVSFLIQLVNLPSLLIFFLLETMFSNANTQALEITALVLQWTIYLSVVLFVGRRLRFRPENPKR